MCVETPLKELEDERQLRGTVPLLLSQIVPVYVKG
jgi:hypothetical protein